MTCRVVGRRLRSVDGTTECSTSTHRARERLRKGYCAPMIDTQAGERGCRPEGRPASEPQQKHESNTRTVEVMMAMILSCMLSTLTVLAVSMPNLRSAVPPLNSDVTIVTIGLIQLPSVRACTFAALSQRATGRALPPARFRIERRRWMQPACASLSSRLGRALNAPNTGQGQEASCPSVRLVRHRRRRRRC
jgi:hypothetical protein